MDETPYDADRADHGSAALDRWLDDGDGAIHPVQLVDLGTISSTFSPGLIDALGQALPVCAALTGLRDLIFGLHRLEDLYILRSPYH